MLISPYPLRQISDTHSSNPIFLKRSTAPRPHLPKAPITSALTPFPLPPSCCLTAVIIAVSFSYGWRRPSFPPFFCADKARAPAAAPANPAWNPKAATRRPLSSFKNSRSYRVPPPRWNRERIEDQPACCLKQWANCMCVWGKGSVDSGSSFNPMIGMLAGALGHELLSTRIQPTLRVEDTRSMMAR